ncbi:uncharacterized protein LOC129835171 [Salvelinus fontinalis]|uniref:uncharacterized protein LOC129835171 n=1 Tax=Salvelinus fontinalis TaxID=8038 RepID=UPI002485DE2A|nr:uncharacterized protein LOC129835171 [Salvelinus fontinalis]
MVTSTAELLLATLTELDKDVLKTFKWYLKQPDGFISQLDFSPIPKCQLEGEDREDIMDKKVKTYSFVTALDISLKMKRNNLAENGVQSESFTWSTDTDKKQFTEQQQQTVKYIKKKIRANPSPERCINLFHCLNELNDYSLVDEIQSYLSSGKLSREELSPAQWSALVFVLLTSEEDLDVFELKKYSRSEEGLLKLLPLVKASRTARLSGCLITDEGCVSLDTALRSTPSHLRELDLSYNHLGDTGVRLLSAGLEDPHLTLEKIKYVEDACELTLDPNTAHRLLTLSQENRKVTWLEEQPYPDHPERFEQREMVVCREALSGRCYWEAEWSFRSYMGMTYKGIDRNKGDDDGVLGSNDKSWSLHCSDKSYSASHNKSATDIPFPSSGSHKVGVYLDWPAGTLSFYSVTSDTLTHLHTFHTTFTEPLYAGFWLLECNTSVSLCKVK